MPQNDHQDLENDAVWQLVDEVRGPGAGPMFSANVMREVRLAADRPERWWQRLLAPAPLAAGTLAAAAAIAFMVMFNSGPGPEGPVVETPEAEEATLAALDSALDEELLITASENPSFFSDEELLAMLY